jgi:hypothetical protein
MPLSLYMISKEIPFSINFTAAICIGELYAFDVKDNWKEYSMVLCYKEN